VIQWLESSRQRGDLKLVLNRLVRTRMLGGVGGVPGNRAPIPIGRFRSRWRPRGGNAIHSNDVLVDALLVTISVPSRQARRGRP
jgi:hypothetical protein